MTLNELIVSLCGLPTVSGSERRSTEALRGLIGAAFDEMQVDALGNHLFIKRCGRQDAPKILIDTHLDEIGMMVNGYRDGGFLAVANVGGVDTRILPAGEVVIYGKETLYGVVAAEPAHLLPAADAEKLKPITEMVIDTGYSKEELEQLVPLGTPVGFKPYTGSLPTGASTEKPLMTRLAVPVLCSALTRFRETSWRAMFTSCSPPLRRSVLWAHGWHPSASDRTMRWSWM